ncbi:MAG: hypothetical protein JSS27_21090 [Planctomycetes bacterium]|nr:hypothetical protein [Planctomycetota bacterium]
MTATAKFPGFYTGAINLWVEDVVTENYLRKAWNDDPAVRFYIGGGADGILAVLKEAESAGLKNVFAYVDRDFRTSNRADWNNPAKGRKFVADVHEVENHLLDCAALAGCRLNSQGRVAADIDTRLKQRAGELAWWMACRRVIAEVRERTLQGFYHDPICPEVTDQTSAEKYVLAEPWRAQVQAYVPTLTNLNLQTALANHHVDATTWITNGQWRSQFSGKELFRHIRGWVYTNAPATNSTSMSDADLAKAIGEWQCQNACVPSEIADLLIALKAKAGVP